MDIQLTDFENTCLIVLMGLITNVINHFNVDFILPISYADANMQRAHYRDAILNQKFYFKTNCLRDPDNYFKSTLADSDYLQSGEQQE
jgi:glutamate--cysteine ligase catalytic subunit